MNPENLIINGLWIGPRLGKMELLTLHSFVAQGHRFRLWVYDEPENDLPEGVELADANEILDRARVFRYPETGPLAWAKGSYAGFSDVFRYRLLYLKGGWWSDMDVTCLQALDFPQRYWFRNHWKHPIVGNLMKVPPGSFLMKRCFDRAVKAVGSENADWDLPIRILNEEVAKSNLLHARHLGRLNEDQAERLELFYKVNSPFPRDWVAVHWCKAAGEFEVIRDSRVWLLYQQYGLL